MKLGIKSLLKMYMISLLILQCLFNIRLGGLPNISCPRLLMILCYLWIFINYGLQEKFWRIAHRSKFNRFILLYALVCLYTALLRSDINAFFGFFVDCMCLYYLILFALEYYFTIDEFVHIITICLSIVTVFGLIEFVTGFNIFTTLSIGESEVISTSYRDGLLRVRGPYGHALAYGMVLLLTFPVSCYSHKDNRVDLFKHPILFFLVTLNMFFTGARSGIAIYGIEIVLIYFASSKKYRGKNFLTAIALMIGVISITTFFSDIPIIQYALRQFFYVIDEIFDTNFALIYGGDMSISASSIARERIWLIPFQSTTLNPWLGQGVSDIGAYLVNGWLVTSIDNFYIRSYISFGIPGLLAIICLYIDFFWENMKCYLSKKNIGCIILIITVFCYMLNLLYVDELNTYRYFFFLMAMGCDLNNHMKKIRC